MARFFLVLITAISAVAVVEAFVASIRRSQQRYHPLNFGIPTFQPKEDEPENPKLEKKKIGLDGLVQLITAGAGAPFLGEFQGVDKETGKFMFSLEANNLVDENGESKQTKMPYFESGWVDPKDLEREQKRKEGGGGFKFPWQS